MLFRILCTGQCRPTWRSELETWLVQCITHRWLDQRSAVMGPISRPRTNFTICRHFINWPTSQPSLGPNSRDSSTRRWPPFLEKLWLTRTPKTSMAISPTRNRCWIFKTQFFVHLLVKKKLAIIFKFASQGNSLQNILINSVFFGHLLELRQS